MTRSAWALGLGERGPGRHLALGAGAASQPAPACLARLRRTTPPTLPASPLTDMPRPQGFEVPLREALCELASLDCEVVVLETAPDNSERVVALQNVSLPISSAIYVLGKGAVRPKVAWEDMARAGGGGAVLWALVAAWAQLWALLTGWLALVPPYGRAMWTG